MTNIMRERERKRVWKLRKSLLVRDTTQAVAVQMMMMMMIENIDEGKPLNV